MSDYTMLSLGMISRGIFLFLLYFNFLYNFGGILNKAIILLVLVGYEMIVANSELCASLAIYHLMSYADL